VLGSGRLQSDALANPMDRPASARPARAFTVLPVWTRTSATVEDVKVACAELDELRLEPEGRTQGQGDGGRASGRGVGGSVARLRSHAHSAPPMTGFSPPSTFCLDRCTYPSRAPRALLRPASSSSVARMQGASIGKAMTV
jgi:hypothetical protein